MPKTPQKLPTVREIEILAFPDVTALDVTGPLEVFTTANQWADRSGLPRPYNVRVVALMERVTASSGLAILADPLPARSKPIDTLVVTGGPGTFAAAQTGTLVTWIAGRAPQARRVASVCTGAFLLGAAGLLKGRRAVTHWDWCGDLARNYPSVRVEADPIFIRDDNVATSAGVTAGIDLMLAFVEEDLGHAAALAVARYLVVYLKRPGGQAQFSDALKLQTRDEGFDRLHGWMSSHLDHDLSVVSLAERAGMSSRTFARRYHQLVGLTPARAVERLRVEAARQMLSAGPVPIKSIARRCGFGSEETMRRSFLRQIGVTPYDYRQCFQPRESVRPKFLRSAGSRPQSARDGKREAGETAEQW
jgi:transcriptional regulator GlxA family with amidase domain